MNRDLFVSESGACAFLISKVKSMRIENRTHVVTMVSGEEHWISRDDAKRLGDLQRTLQLPPFRHEWFACDHCAFDPYYITSMRNVANGTLITFDTSSGILEPITLSEDEYSKLLVLLSDER